MEFVRTPDYRVGLDKLQSALVAGLSSNKRVLWLLSGGSNIIVSVQIMAGIDEALSARLSVALCDERFGPPGHADSNWQQLKAAGFDTKAAEQVEVLFNPFDDLTAATQRYNAELERLFSKSDIIIGQFGIGADGHIAGILPRSEAVNAQGLAVGYVTDVHTRITSTFQAIKRCQSAYVFAFGDDKRAALNNLIKDVSLGDQPAQILKQLSDVHIYNDQIGDAI